MGKPLNGFANMFSPEELSILTLYNYVIGFLVCIVLFVFYWLIRLITSYREEYPDINHSSDNQVEMWFTIIPLIVLMFLANFSHRIGLYIIALNFINVIFLTYFIIFFLARFLSMEQKTLIIIDFIGKLLIVIVILVLGVNLIYYIFFIVKILISLIKVPIVKAQEKQDSGDSGECSPTQYCGRDTRIIIEFAEENRLANVNTIDPLTKVDHGHPFDFSEFRDLTLLNRGTEDIMWIALSKIIPLNLITEWLNWIFGFNLQGNNQKEEIFTTAEIENYFSFVVGVNKEIRDMIGNYYSDKLPNTKVPD